MIVRPVGVALALLLAAGAAGAAPARGSARPRPPAPAAAEAPEDDPLLDAFFDGAAWEDEPEAVEPPPVAPAPTAHRRGRAPREPAARLPAEVPPTEADPAARRSISGTAPAPDPDPELERLREAERVLFARPLLGAVPGWEWESAPRDGEGRARAGLPGSAGGEAPGTTDEVVSDAEWLRSLALPNLAVTLDERVVRYLKFYRDDPAGRSLARIWARKHGRYAPALRSALARAGLPTDLVWLSLVESGHNPTIVSPVGAAGLWQFMPATARTYGLTVDRWVDERLDPERATEAAVRYLSDLHRRFGNWDLAMAAYNMGHGGLVRVVRRFNSNDFWELSRLEGALPWETTLYVPKILALAVVMNNKKAFALDDVAGDPAVSFDVVRVAPGTALEDVARAAGVPLATLGGLNPQYLAGRVPPVGAGTSQPGWGVRVPKGLGVAVTQSLAKAADPAASYDPYVVRVGDSVEGIAGSRGASEQSLRRINRIASGEELAAGTVLLIPRRDGNEAGPDREDVVVVPARAVSVPGRERVFYRVVGGDTLSRVAHAFGVGRLELLHWNALDATARLHAGMTLQVWVPPGRDLDHVRYVREEDTRVLVAGSPEFVDHFEAERGKRRQVVEAAAGDTLASIGKRYGLSPGWMERINRFSRSKKLKAGERVVVYVKGPPPAPEAPPAVAAAQPAEGGGGAEAPPAAVGGQPVEGAPMAAREAPPAAAPAP